MFALTTKQSDRDCQGRSRRDFLRIGGLGLAGLTLPQLLAAQAWGAGGGYVRDRSVVLLFLQGGPSHIEFFDPKMTAPSEIRSVTGDTPTAHAGISFGGTFPKLASLAHDFTVVRSYGSRNSGHSYESITTAANPLKAAMGSIYARVAGTNHPRSGMPRNILLKPEAVQDGLKLGSNFETGALPTLTQAGDLGTSFAAFDPSGGGELKSNLELKVDEHHLGDRRNLLAQLDGLKRMADRVQLLAGADKFQQQAFDVITGGIADAFDLRKEDPQVVERYDTSHLFRNDEVQRWGDMRRSTNLLGRQLLLARRLCEAGCGFVTVSDCGWDMHSNGNSPKHLGGMTPLGNQVDHAVSAFIEDVKARGLEDKILLAVTGEMGRTPKINNNGGRDHYGELTPLLLFGGGLKMGQVIGQSDSQAARPATEPYTPKELFGTLMHALFDIGKLRLDSSLPAEILRFIERSQPIGGLS